MTNDEYREKARELFPDLTIAVHAAVQPLADGGAFVEATVFVAGPKPPLARPPQQRRKERS